MRTRPRITPRDRRTAVALETLEERCTPSGLLGSLLAAPVLPAVVSAITAPFAALPVVSLQAGPLPVALGSGAGTGTTSASTPLLSLGLGSGGGLLGTGIQLDVAGIPLLSRGTAPGNGGGSLGTGLQVGAGGAPLLSVGGNGGGLLGTGLTLGSTSTAVVSVGVGASAVGLGTKAPASPAAPTPPPSVVGSTVTTAPLPVGGSGEEATEAASALTAANARSEPAVDPAGQDTQTGQSPAQAASSPAAISASEASAALAVAVNPHAPVAGADAVALEFVFDTSPNSNDGHVVAASFAAPSRAAPTDAPALRPVPLPSGGARDELVAPEAEAAELVTQLQAPERDPLASLDHLFAAGDDTAGPGPWSFVWKLSPALVTALAATLEVRRRRRRVGALTPAEEPESLPEFMEVPATEGGCGL